MSADQRLEHMTQMLNLTADQQAKIKPLLETEQTQMQSLRADSSLSRDDRRAKAQQLRESTNQQINGILTPEQQQKWQQAQERHREHMGHGGMGAGASQAPPQQAPPQ
jgi:Spy/CpxP family protein refolding chaperone